MRRCAVSRGETGAAPARGSQLNPQAAGSGADSARKRAREARNRNKQNIQQEERRPQSRHSESPADGQRVMKGTPCVRENGAKRKQAAVSAGRPAGAPAPAECSKPNGAGRAPTRDQHRKTARAKSVRASPTRRRAKPKESLLTGTGQEGRGGQQFDGRGNTSGCREVGLAPPVGGVRLASAARWTGHGYLRVRLSAG